MFNCQLHHINILAVPIYLVHELFVIILFSASTLVAVELHKKTLHHSPGSWYRKDTK